MACYEGMGDVQRAQGVGGLPEDIKYYFIYQLK